MPARSIRQIYDADVGVGDLPEGLESGICVVNRDGEEDVGDVGRYSRDVDVDDFVVAVTFTGEVVAGVLDGSVGRAKVVVEDEVQVGKNLAFRAGDQRAGVEVEVGTTGAACIPAETDCDLGEVGCGFRQRYVAALGKCDAHSGSSRSNEVDFFVREFCVVRSRLTLP